MKYIDFKVSDKNVAFYIGALMLLFSHLIHFTDNNDFGLILLFKILFIAGYTMFNISEYMKTGQIHIASLTMRISIIIIVIASIVYDYDRRDN